MIDRLSSFAFLAVAAWAGVHGLVHALWGCLILSAIFHAIAELRGR
jgi:hypothetical protein